MAMVFRSGVKPLSLVSQKVGCCPEPPLRGFAGDTQGKKARAAEKAQESPRMVVRTVAHAAMVRTTVLPLARRVADEVAARGSEKALAAASFDDASGSKMVQS